MVIFFVLVVMLVLSIQPILMVVGLVILTLLYSMYMYMYMGGYWFSYVLVMVMLSGVFVIFSYMSSLVPNESFEVYEVMFLLSLIMMFVYKWGSWFSGDLGYVSLNLWINYLGLFSLFLVFFLFSIMVLVVWLSNKGMGAIRVD